MKVFVTGASGFIGRRLCLRLADAGHDILALARDVDSPFLRTIPVRWVRGDVLDPESYADALEGVEVIYHLAGDPTFGQGEHYYEINTEATRRLVETAQKRCPDLRRFVFTSTLGAVDRAPGDRCQSPLDETSECRPTSDYGRSKLEAERIVAGTGLPWTIIRPTLIVGPEMRYHSHVAVFSRAALTGGLMSRFDFPGRFSVLHVDDLAAALTLVAEHEGAVGRTFFAAGDPVRLGDIFAWAAPKAWRMPAAWVHGLLGPIFRFVPFNLKSLFYDVLTVSDQALRDLGWEKTRSARESVDEVIAVEQRRMDPDRGVQGYTLVTGAASGLGLAVAELLHAKGRRLILVDKDEEGLGRAASGASEAIRIAADLSRDEDLDRLLAQPWWFETPGVDELFACAGFGARGPVHRTDGKTQADVVKVNLAARIRLSRQAASFMAARHFGRIVLVSSSSAFQPLPYMAAYAASNAGLLSFGEALFGELEGEGVEVLTVCPGGMKTRFQQNAGVKVLSKEKLDPPEKVAEKIYGALGKNLCTLEVGLRSKGMDIAARLLPRKTRVRLWRKLMGTLR